MRRLYRIDRAPRLGGEHPFPAGPPLRGGVAWLGVIQRPGRLAISRASASVSAVLSARACPLHPVGRVWPSSHDQPFPTLRRGAPSHLRCVYGSVRPRTCTVSNGNPVERERERERETERERGSLNTQPRPAFVSRTTYLFINLQQHSDISPFKPLSTKTIRPPSHPAPLPPG